MNKYLNILFLVIVAVFGFLYRERIINNWTQVYNHYFPCRSPITYRLGEFDTKFGVSKTDFLNGLTQAEKIWETSVNKDLFKYDPNGDLVINLIYDSRQATTEQLKKMGVVVSNSKTAYDSLKAKYLALQSEYSKAKSFYDSKVADFEQRKATYEAEVNKINQNGGANKATIIRINAEKDSINSEISVIKSLQVDLNNRVDDLNALATALNDIAKSLNLTVDRFNTIGQSLGGEFEEGNYTQDSTGTRIDIYQFENKTKLVRVLAHELGHALGLEHNEDPKAIMYRLNNGVNEKLTQADIIELKTLCGIK